MKAAIARLTLGTVIGLAIIGIGIAGRAYTRTRSKDRFTGCVHNLRMIKSGKERAALAYKIPVGAVISVDSANEYIEGRMIPKCPGGGTYRYEPTGVIPTCSQAAEGHVLVVAAGQN